jgi:hypothetical protein
MTIVDTMIDTAEAIWKSLRFAYTAHLEHIFTLEEMPHGASGACR